MNSGELRALALECVLALNEKWGSPAPVVQVTDISICCYFAQRGPNIWTAKFEGWTYSGRGTTPEDAARDLLRQLTLIVRR